MLWKLPDIKLAPDVIATPWGFPITNTLLCTWITIILLAVVCYLGTRRRDMIPSGLQNFVEWGVESLLKLVNQVVGGNREKAKRFFPLVATFFIFILFANLLDVIPGVDTIGTISDPVAQSHALFGFLLVDYNYSNHVIPWIRPATSDLNLTLAMALVSVITTQAFGFYTLGAKTHLSKYFNFRGPVDFFVGIVEIISEAARIISFSFRLFGNIFAGSAVLAVFAFVLPFFADIAFIPLELFIAFMQALVFAMLTLVFMEIATSSHDVAESEYEAHKEYEQKEVKSAAH